MQYKEIKHTTKWTKNKLIKFSIFSILIILVFLEISFRILFSSQNAKYHNSISVQGSPLQISDSVLIFKNAPFYLDYYKKFQRNEEGMKSALGDEFIPVKKPEDFWVLLTGASAMEGMGSNRNNDWLDITGVDDHSYDMTISFYLQNFLQAQMPKKKVRVFNGAFSTAVLFQSYHRYIQLEQKLQPDWVVSMDGVNDPSTLTRNETVEEKVKDEWDDRPQFHYPLKLIIPITSHSAFFNFVKQKMFAIKQTLRSNAAIKGDFPFRKKWANYKAPAIRLTPLNENIKRAVDSFCTTLLKYDSLLIKDGRKHLLLVQPHMFHRDTTLLTNVEKAVNNYYRSVFQDYDKQAFLKEIYNRFLNDGVHNNIISMLAVHHWRSNVFVDYCHFSDDATLKIAQGIAEYILSDGKKEIF